MSAHVLLNLLAIFHGTSEKDEIYLVFAEKVNCLVILYSTEIQKAQINFFFGRFSIDLTFAVCLFGKTICVNID